MSCLNEVNSLQLCLDFIADFLQLLPATPNHLLIPQRGDARETGKVVKCKRLPQNVYANHVPNSVLCVCVCVCVWEGGYVKYAV